MELKQGWTLTHALLALVLLAGGGSLALAAISSEERGDRALAAGVDVRDILRGLAIYAEANQNRLPGQVGNPNDVDSSVPGRFAPLVRDNLIVSTTVISPMEDLQPWDPQKGQPMTIEHCSYGLQEVEQVGNGARAWKNDTNAAAVLIADRDTGEGDDLASVWTPGTGHATWAGVVGWGDTHVTIEDDPTVTTIVENVLVKNDMLFDSNDNARLTFLRNAEGEEVAVPRRADGGEEDEGSEKKDAAERAGDLVE